MQAFGLSLLALRYSVLGGKGVWRCGAIIWLLDCSSTGCTRVMRRFWVQ